MIFRWDIERLFSFFNITYDQSEWRLFIDSSKCSLKDVLLYNGNLFGSIPVAHSVNLKEICENLKALLKYVNYEIILGQIPVIESSWYVIQNCLLSFVNETTKPKMKHLKVTDWTKRETPIWFIEYNK